MMTHSMIRRFAAVLATAVALVAFAAVADAFARSPAHGAAPVTSTENKPQSGYGRGWCYWRPYACRYRVQAD
jgi:hypothetical protein